MQYTSFLVLAVAFASCCSAQKNAADAVKSIDSITQALVKVEGLVDGVTADDAPEGEAGLAPLTDYRDTVVLEDEFSKNASPEIQSTATEKEKEEICVSQNKSIDKHILLLDTLITKHDVFTKTFHDVATAVLKVDEKAMDELAFKILDLAPDCKMTAINDLSDKFTAALDKYDA